MTELAPTLAAHGVSLAALQAQAEALILFGSRATDLARPDSDWDLLVVGRGRTTLARGLDLVVVAPDEFDSLRWRGGELAGHIAHFGRTLDGSPRWLESLKPGPCAPAALEHKRRVIVAQLHACARYWPKLGNWAQEKRLLRLRRDLQRHALLLAGAVVPPTAVLDDEWSRGTSTGLDELLSGFEQHPFIDVLRHQAACF